ncbi:hypothetical protein TNCV_3887721 [Trichonephila clavipes]|nr:hypothetical protein TNCV_3887721 [Trichonephila clavipes]
MKTLFLSVIREAVGSRGQRPPGLKSLLLSANVVELACADICLTNVPTLTRFVIWLHSNPLPDQHGQLAHSSSGIASDRRRWKSSAQSSVVRQWFFPEPIGIEISANSQWILELIR